MRGRRVFFPNVGVCELESFEVPSTFPANEVLLKIHRTLVSPGTELTIFQGRHSNFRNPNSSWPTFPFYPGYSAAGEVLAVGNAVTKVRPGDIVFAEVAHTSHAVVSEGKVIKVNPGIDLEELAFTELGAIALHGVRSGAVTVGERVAIFGQGLVGLLALGFARNAGATRLTVFDLDPGRLEISRRWGANEATLPGGVSADKVREVTGGYLADVVIEATGSPAVIADCLSCVRTGGRVVLLGSPHGDLTVNFYENVHIRNIRLIGAHVGASSHAATNFAPWNRDRNRQTFLDLVERGDMPVQDLITHWLNPAELPDLYRYSAKMPGTMLGVIVDWENES